MSSVIAASAVCKSALPYIKPVLATDGPAITFPQGDEPVALDLENDLLVMYLVDRGTHFAYVQSKDLAAEKLSTSELHELALKNLAALASDRLRVQKHSRIYVPLL